MTIFEKVTQSKDLRVVYLYKEGVFWIAYEQSAYLVSQVKALKPTKKYVKTIDREVVSVGFPDTVLSTVLQSFRLITKNDFQIVVESEAAIELPAFEAWKSELPLRTINKASSKGIFAHHCEGEDRSNLPPNPLKGELPLPLGEGFRIASPQAARNDVHEVLFSLSPELSILKKLQIFSLADKTPIECMFFLSDLQKQLQLYGDVR